MHARPVAALPAPAWQPLARGVPLATTEREKRARASPIKRTSKRSIKVSACQYAVFVACVCLLRRSGGWAHLKPWRAQVVVGAFSAAADAVSLMRTPVLAYTVL